MKLLCGMLALTCASAALGGNAVPFPEEQLGKFVLEKLDVTTLPPGIRPKRDKGKKTFEEYGYVTRQLDEKEVLVEATSAGTQIKITVLEQAANKLFVCINGQGKNAESGAVQRVFLLKQKNSDGLLKGRESWREFSSCPVIGGAGGDSSGDSYGGG